jgi:hypothetical protein
MSGKGGYKGRIVIRGGFFSKKGGYKRADKISGGFYEKERTKKGGFNKGRILVRKGADIKGGF